MAQLKNTTIDTTGFLDLPAGTTAQRPGSPVTGMTRFNTSLNYVEYYNGSEWLELINSDTYLQATGGTVIDANVGGIDYRSHIFTRGTFDYVSNSSASSLGFSAGPADVKGERDNQTACSGLLTFEQALGFVHAIGARLPTRDEIYRGVANFTGCGYDAELVWTCDKADENGDSHFVVIGNVDSNGGVGDDTVRPNSSTAYVSYVADVDTNRTDPVRITDPVIYNYLNSNYPSHIPTTANTFSVTKGGNVEILVVGGGAGGGRQTSGAGAAGGGGGAGGVVIERRTLAPGTYAVSIGKGGADRISTATNIYAENGENSVFDDIIALGGGGAGTRDYDGRDGGSGGGTNRVGGSAGSALQPGSASGGFGNPGGVGQNFPSPSPGGGGGGAGDQGGDDFNSNLAAGRGGHGITSDFAGFNVFYGGGGGGGNGYTPNTGRGGYGGGGDGGDAQDAATSRSLPGYPAANNTGSGGGGSAGTAAGGRGGDGIVIVRYRRNLNDNSGLQEFTDDLIFKADAADPLSYNGARVWRSTVGNGTGLIESGTEIIHPRSNSAAMNFNANSHYVDFGSPFVGDNLTDIPFTISTWVYPTALASSRTWQLILKIRSSGSNYGIKFGKDSDNRFTFGFWRSDTLADRLPWSSNHFLITTNLWYHLTVTYNGQGGGTAGNIKFYLNGNLGTTLSTGYTLSLQNAENTIRIAGRSRDTGSDESWYYTGRVPIVKIYDRELDVNEIKQDFNYTRWRYGI